MTEHNVYVCTILLKIGLLLYTIKPNTYSKYKNNNPKIQPFSSKNNRDPSKNKWGYGWILGYLFNAHIQHSAWQGIPVYTMGGDNEARRRIKDGYQRTKDLSSQSGY